MLQLKEVTRETVDLSDGDGVDFVDGHFLMLKMVFTENAAEALVMDSNEVPLFKNCAAERKVFVDARWTVSNRVRRSNAAGQAEDLR